MHLIVSSDNCKEYLQLKSLMRCPFFTLFFELLTEPENNKLQNILNKKFITFITTILLIQPNFRKDQKMNYQNGNSNPDYNDVRYTTTIISERNIPGWAQSLSIILMNIFMSIALKQEVLDFTRKLFSYKRENGDIWETAITKYTSQNYR